MPIHSLISMIKMYTSGLFTDPYQFHNNNVHNTWIYVLLNVLLLWFLIYGSSNQYTLGGLLQITVKVIIQYSVKLACLGMVKGVTLDNKGLTKDSVCITVLGIAKRLQICHQMWATTYRLCCMCTTLEKRSFFFTLGVKKYLRCSGGQAGIPLSVVYQLFGYYHSDWTPWVLCHHSARKLKGRHVFLSG